MNGEGDYQVHRALKERLQIFQQAEVGIRVLIQVQLLEGDEEVEIAVRCVKARGVEIRPDGGPEKLDAMHPAAAAHAFQFLTLLLNQAVHGVLRVGLGRRGRPPHTTYSELIFDRNWLFAVVLLSLSMSSSMASTGDSGFSTLRRTQIRCKSSFGISSSSLRVPER